MFEGSRILAVFDGGQMWQARVNFDALGRIFKTFESMGAAYVSTSSGKAASTVTLINARVFYGDWTDVVLSFIAPVDCDFADVPSQLGDWHAVHMETFSGTMSTRVFDVHYVHKGTLEGGQFSGFYAAGASEVSSGSDATEVLDEVLGDMVPTRRYDDHFVPEDEEL